MTEGRRINLKNATSKEIIAFSLLPFGVFIINTTVGTLINFYMTDILKLSMSLASIIILGTKLWDAINDPLMGQIVERTRTKWGKCRPYLLFMALPLAIVAAMLFLPIKFPDSLNIYGKDGELLGNGGNFAYLLIVYMIYITFYTAIEIPYNSLNPLVFPEKNERVKAISLSNTLGSMGSILPSVLIWLMIGLIGNGQKDITDWGYFGSSIIFTLIGAGLIMISFAGIKEKIYIPPQKTACKKNLAIIFKDKRIIILLISAFSMGIINIGSMFLTYFARWNCIGILPMEKINEFIASIVGKNPNLDSVSIIPTLLSILSGASYMISMLIVPKFLKKLSKKQLWIWMSFIGALANILTYIIGVYILPYNTIAGFITYIILRFFTNFPVGMSLVLLVSMFADITDDIELSTGNRVEATAFSFKGLLYKISLAVFNVVVLQIINGLGYNASKMEEITDKVTKPLIQSTTIDSIIGGVNYTTLLNGIFFMLTVLGAIGLILQAIPMFFYKFDEEAMEIKLKQLREEKQKEKDNSIFYPDQINIEDSDTNEIIKVK